MDIVRQGQIARKLVKFRFRNSGINTLSHEEFKRDLGDGAKKMGIPLEELLEFAEIIIRELVDELFPRK
ncbi:MAG: hypothetical protein A2V60_02090 [Candidatus Portnoybacteria bacterium RIFCSPHIGHO2_01_FULL_39_19]|nr:MAG: hypothetical protein A2V60_02090 [Candidatus Portnoybacteria bacterium RIFCSPHIGHO2_01_FULL_39_19]